MEISLYVDRCLFIFVFLSSIILPLPATHTWIFGNVYNILELLFFAEAVLIIDW